LIVKLLLTLIMLESVPETNQY